MKAFSIKKIKPGQVMLYLMVIALVSFTALPLIYVISTAFKPIDELFVFPPRFFVRRPTLTNFSDLFTALNTSTVPFVRYIFNSFFVTIVIVVLTVIVSALGAYGLVKHAPKGSGTIMAIVIAALMFSGHVTQIPSYVIVQSMGLVNNYGALILPKIAVAYNFFLMERFMRQVPDALIEACRIDGANEWTIFWRVVMPMLKPAWATLVVFSFISNWNDYFSALVYIDSQAMKTLPLALQTIMGGAGGTGYLDMARVGAGAAISFIMIIPTIIIYVSMQSLVMRTMAHSGIKA